MSKSYLVPKQVVDKNGVQTTRWVRPSTLKASQAGIPSPSLLGEGSSVASLMKEASVLLAGDTGDASKNINFLGQVAPDRLESIVNQCKQDDNIKQLWSVRMRNMNMTPFDDSEDEYLLSLNFYDRHIAIYPMAMDIIRETGDHFAIDSALRNYTQTVADEVTSFLMRGTNLGSRKDREIPSDELVKALAIVTSVRGMYAEPYWRMDNSRTEYEHISEDAAYISKHVYEVLPLVPLMIERKSHDRGWLAEMIDGKATALSSGAL